MIPISLDGMTMEDDQNIGTMPPIYCTIANAQISSYSTRDYRYFTGTALSLYIVPFHELTVISELR